MQRKGLRHTDGGKAHNISGLNLAVVSLVLFFNLSDQYVRYDNIFELLAYTAPFVLIIIIVAFFWGNKTFQAIIFLIIAIGTTLDPANISDYSGAIFFIYSFHLIKKNWYAGFIALLSIGCLTVRSILAHETIPGTLIMIAVFAYIYAIYYFLFYKHEPKKSPLSKEQEYLMRMVSEQGLTQKEIAVKLSISQDKVFTKIKEIRELLTPEGLNTITKEQAIYIIVSKYGISDGK